MPYFAAAYAADAVSLSAADYAAIDAAMLLMPTCLPSRQER